MFHTGLEKYEYSTVDNFTSDFGMRFRKAINPLWRQLLKLAVKEKVYVTHKARLKKDETYIFACSHSFGNDVVSIEAYLDRNAYILNGSTHQTRYNPLAYAFWVNGMVYVNRMNQESRNSAVDKMLRVLKHGYSILLFPEGGYNNTENLLIMPLFNGPYLLSQETHIKVVPVICFQDIWADSIYINIGEPMELWKYEKHEGAVALRDRLATMLWDILTERTQPIKRSELDDRLRAEIRKKSKGKSVGIEKMNTHELHMEMRKLIYADQTWYADVWDEELTSYKGHGVTLPSEAFGFIDKVHVTKDNAWVLAPVLARREQAQRYDLKEYIREHLKLKGVKTRG